MRSPPVHCASHKCIGHCADFRALPVAMLPALVQALLRSPPALRSALPRAVSSAPPSVQSPRRLHRASRDGADSPIAHTAGFTDLTARGGFGFHTPRIGDAGVPYGPISCLFVVFWGRTGSCDCWTERVSVRYTRIVIVLSPGDRSCRPPIHGPTYEDSGTDTRALCAGFSDMRLGCGHSSARRAQSAAPWRSDSWKARASATSASNSFSRPSLTIASRFSVVRNQA